MFTFVQDSLHETFFNMSSPQVKEVKLQPKIRALAYSQKLVPELTISGVWLEEQGFHAGQLVEITIRHQELVIKPKNNEQG